MDDVKSTSTVFPTGDPSILIIGAGISGLITAKTLFEDGFTNLTVVTSADRVGGVWALGDDGGVYPGLLTNSAYGNFELSALSMPQEDLEVNEHRIRGDTVSRYLQEFYRLFLQGRVSFRFSTTVVGMTRTTGEGGQVMGKGWTVTTEEKISSRKEISYWDKVVLAQGPHSIPSFPDCLSPSSASASAFKGILLHTCQVHSSADAKILAHPGPIVVIGCGKSAIDLAARYAAKGKQVSIVFRKAKYFSGHNLRTDYLLKTRLISTIHPNQALKTLIERLIHQTSLGSWYLRSWQQAQDVGRNASLKVEKNSPLYRDDIEPIWRGPDVNGGRSSATREDSFHVLVSKDRITAIGGVGPAAISADGKGLVLSNGEVLPAGVIICGTGFTSSFGFISKAERESLGIEPMQPHPTTKSALEHHVSLADPPAPPSLEPASHIYKGIVPFGAFEERDLVINGFQAVLGLPLTAEIASHWISSFFQHDPNLRLPSNSEEAYDHAEKHANWLRARYPLSSLGYDTQKHFPLNNASQYNDGLLEDLGLETFREDSGWFGLGWYYNLTESRNYQQLAKERLELRLKRGKDSRRWYSTLFS